MLNKAKTLKGYKLDSLDGEFGEVEQFYFDDRYWTIRYMVANTGNWLPGRQVLISPYALVAAIKADQHVAVDLTKKQIKDGPALSTDEPVSRQFEKMHTTISHENKAQSNGVDDGGAVLREPRFDRLRTGSYQKDRHRGAG